MNAPVIVSQKHRMVGVPATPQLEGLFPHAIQAGGLLAVPHRIDEWRLLKNLGFDVPAPVLTQYDWAGGTPFEVQRKTVALLTTERRAYCLNAMGTGKSRAALWAFDFLKQEGVAKRLLVVAPLSTLAFVWAREILQTVPHLKAVVLHGSRAKRLKTLAEPHDVAIVNHDGIAVLHDELLKGDYDTLVIDELAVYRNGLAPRSKKMANFASSFERTWGMTGSPTPTEPTDVWGQARIVTPGRTERRFTRFRDELMVKIGTFKWLPKPDATERAYTVLQPSVRFTLDDVIELPELVERTLEVELGPQQKRTYEELRKHAHTLVQAREITAVNAGVVLNKLLQVASGFVYAGPDRAVVKLDCGARLQALEDLIEACDRKVIIYVPFKHALQGVHDYLAAQGIDVTPGVSGDTSMTERSRIFSAFQQSSKYKVLLAHPQCVAHGLTLTAADTVVWWSPSPSLEIFSQANARITRVGQRHRQQVIMLSGTSAERRIYGLLKRRQDFQNELLDLFEEAST